MNRIVSLASDLCLLRLRPEYSPKIYMNTMAKVQGRGHAVRKGPKKKREGRHRSICTASPFKQVSSGHQSILTFTYLPLKKIPHDCTSVVSQQDLRRVFHNCIGIFNSWSLSRYETVKERFCARGIPEDFVLIICRPHFDQSGTFQISFTFPIRKLGRFFYGL